MAETLCLHLLVTVLIRFNLLWDNTRLILLDLSINFYFILLHLGSWRTTRGTKQQGKHSFVCLYRELQGRCWLAGHYARHVPSVLIGGSSSQREPRSRGHPTTAAKVWWQETYTVTAEGAWFESHRHRCSKYDALSPIPCCCWRQNDSDVTATASAAFSSAHPPTDDKRRFAAVTSQCSWRHRNGVSDAVAALLSRVTSPGVTNGAAGGWRFHAGLHCRGVEAG